MRCPYCHGLNQEKAIFCVNCGRDLRQQRPVQQPLVPPTSRPVNLPPQRPANPPTQPAPTNRRPAPAPGQASLVPPPPPTTPGAPAPFPPRTIQQFEALLATGCQAYTVIESSVENGKKKILTITYPRCAGWQQAATLLKALRDNREEQYTTIIVRGFLTPQKNQYGFTNGQLQFDRDVLLGTWIGNRYVVETDNGYSAEALRFVLNT